MVPSTILTLGTSQHQHLISKFSNGNVCMSITQSWIILLKYLL